MYLFQEICEQVHEFKQFDLLKVIHKNLDIVILNQIVQIYSIRLFTKHKCFYILFTFP